MKDTTLAFIGAGNMARSLIGGLIADGFDPKKIWATNPNAEKLSKLQQQFGIQVTTDNKAGAEKAGVLIFSVKPSQMKTVAEEIATVVQKNKPLVISVATSITEKSLREWFECKTSIVRCMPNMPALIRSGATALFANAEVKEEQKSLAESIMRAVGVTVWLNDEAQLDAVTALSGSGPAYFFRVMQSMEQAAERLGLPSEVSHLLTLQTALGAARIALESEESIIFLKQRVTSPGGTTERALQVLDEGNIDKLFYDALKAAEERAKELGKTYNTSE